MSEEETRELQRDAHDLAYQAILFSGLYKSLSNEAWDAKAAVYSHLIVKLMEELIAEDETALEMERQAVEMADAEPQ